MEVFTPDPRPDGGDFAKGDGHAALAYDIIKFAGGHRVPDRIDLSRCVHFKPYALACLCGIGALARTQGKEVELVLPTSTDCCEHLCRLEVPTWFKCGPLPAVVQRPTNLALEQLSWPVRNSAEKIIELLAPRAQLSPGISGKLMASLDEIAENALTHAESPIDCIVTGQAFQQAKKVEIAVLDLGQTIRGHLVRNPEYGTRCTSDSAAILLAVEDGITGTPPGTLNSRGQQNSGAGLHFVKEFCQSGGGELTILSGSHWVTFGAGEPVIGTIRGPRFGGSLVNVRFFVDAHLPGTNSDPIL